jgi:glycerol uptake facilitator-like aquaporin
MPDKHPILHTLLESLMILFFEMIGTFLLTTLYMLNGYNPLSMFIGFFILLILSARISGSHYNPIVTLSFMLRRDAGQFNRWLGILYMLFQLGGALLGAFVAYYVFATTLG